MTTQHAICRCCGGEMPRPVGRWTEHMCQACKLEFHGQAPESPVVGRDHKTPQTPASDSGPRTTEAGASFFTLTARESEVPDIGLCLDCGVEVPEAGLVCDECLLNCLND